MVTSAKARGNKNFVFVIGDDAWLYVDVRGNFLESEFFGQSENA
jgi:hypothetical protein